MRMPILAYFAVVGAGLLAILLLIGNTIAPNGAPIATTQAVGLPEPFKAAPTPAPELAQQPKPAPTLVSAPMPAPRPLIASRHAANKKIEKTTARNRFAEYPHGGFFSIR